MSYKNIEGYTDNTAGEAVREADRPPKQIKQLIYITKVMFSLMGFEIIGRIRLRDRETGREW